MQKWLHLSWHVCKTPEVCWPWSDPEQWWVWWVCGQSGGGFTDPLLRSGTPGECDPDDLPSSSANINADPTHCGHNPSHLPLYKITNIAKFLNVCKMWPILHTILAGKAILILILNISIIPLWWFKVLSMKYQRKCQRGWGALKLNDIWSRVAPNSMRNIYWSVLVILIKKCFNFTPIGGCDTDTKLACCSILLVQIMGISFFFHPKWCLNNWTIVDTIK